MIDIPLTEDPKKQKGSRHEISIPNGRKKQRENSEEHFEDGVPVFQKFGQTAPLSRTGTL
jgi:hypothetical protein